MLHKPGGVTSTVRDRHASKTVLDMIPTALLPEGGRLYPGRTARPGFRGPARADQRRRAGPIACSIRATASSASTRSGCGRRSARDQVEGDQGRHPARRRSRHARRGLRATTEIETRRLIELISPPPGNLTWYRAILAQGWKRQLRRMFGAVGAPIERLVRVRMGPVRLDELQSGRARRLRAPEVRGLGAGAGVSRAGVKTARANEPRPSRPPDARR